MKKGFMELFQLSMRAMAWEFVWVIYTLQDHNPYKRNNTKYHYVSTPCTTTFLLGIAHRVTWHVHSHRQRHRNNHIKYNHDTNH